MSASVIICRAAKRFIALKDISQAGTFIKGDMKKFCAKRKICKCSQRLATEVVLAGSFVGQLHSSTLCNSNLLGHGGPITHQDGRTVVESAMLCMLLVEELV